MKSILAALPDTTGRRLTLYADLLAKWQPTINLVAPSTLPALWDRHIADSMQVQAVVPQAKYWVDLGSGGGFPGLVTAILLAEETGAHVHLVESDKRKCAFLRTVVREVGLPATVHAERIETFVASCDGRVDAVSARALAPLPQLLAFAQKFIEAGAIGVFPKGQTAAAELTGSDLGHRFTVESVPSQTDRSSSLLIVRAGRPA